MARIRWQTGSRLFGAGRKDHQSHRSFPTEGYLRPAGEGETETVEKQPLQWGGQAFDDGGWSDPVAIADHRVMRGPTQADRDNLPYVQEAWEWAIRVTRAVGLRRRNRDFPCVLDLLTRMRIAALIERRNLAWPETAAMVAGLDLLRIHAEHHARPEEVETYLLRVRGFIHEGLDDGWDGVVWGDIDPADPLRSLEIDREACEGCGRCVIVCPQAFARAKGGEIVVKSPTAVRQKDLEESCLEAVSECPEGAIRLNSRGGRTATGVLPPRGRPLPGERQD